MLPKEVRTESQGGEEEAASEKDWGGEVWGCTCIEADAAFLGDVGAGGREGKGENSLLLLLGSAAGAALYAA